MLRDMPRIILLALIAFMLIFSIGYFTKNNLTKDSTVESMQETLKSTALSDRDDSVRITRGSFLLQKDKFESDFKKRFNASKSLNSAITNYNFDYLDDSRGGIKAIKVKVICGQKKYQATCILDVAD